MAVISAFHDVSEDCTQEGILKTDELIAGLPPEDERRDIATIAGALTKKNTITDQVAQLSDRLDRILNTPPQATLVRIATGSITSLIPPTGTADSRSATLLRLIK